MGDRLFRKELVEKGPILGHIFWKVSKMSKNLTFGSKINRILIWLA